MKLAELVGQHKLTAKKTKKILRRMDRVDNPKPSDIPTGWRASPFQGSLGGSLNWR